jgi:hypothetical protein
VATSLHFIGNKAYALLAVAREIETTFGDDVGALVLLDDDTQLPNTFFTNFLKSPYGGGNSGSYAA